MRPIVGREQPAFLHQSGLPHTRIDGGRPVPTALYPKASKGQRAERAREWGARGKALPEKAKRPPACPPPGHPHALSVPAETASGRCRSVACTRHRSPERAAATGIGRIAAGDTAPAEAAGTHLAAHLALAQAVRRAVPHADWNAMPSWSRLSLHPKHITMPTQAACSTTAWKSSPTA
jgi:hypothetical protein